MANNTVMDLANVSVVAVAKEEINMTKADLRKALEEKGIAMSNAEFKATKKVELEARLAAAVAVETKKQAKIPVNPLDDPTVMDIDDEKYLIVPTPVVAKAWRDMTSEEKLADAKLPKWDKLIKAVAAEYVKQSLGVKWALFYKNTKSTTTKAEYLVKTKKLWGATSKVIKNLYGEKNCNENTIQQTLNAMVVRGYLNFQKVQGKNGTNVIFNASADQMNAMYKLSK